MFEERFMKDTIVLIKPDGTRTEDIKAKVSEERIKTYNVTLQIEQGDIVERKLPNGLTEIYEVLDVTQAHGIPQSGPSQEMKVRKLNAFQDKPQPVTVHNYHGVQSVQHGSNNTAYNTQNFGLETQQLADLITQMRTSVHDLDLPEEDKEEAQQMLDVLEEQAKAQPSNVARIKVLAKSAALYLANKGVDVSVAIGGTVLGEIILKSIYR
jgi:hypothetical protein